MHNIHAHVLPCNERNIPVCCKFTQLHSRQILLKSVNIWLSYCEKQKGELFWNTVYVYYHESAKTAQRTAIKNYTEYCRRKGAAKNSTWFRLKVRKKTTSVARLWTPWVSPRRNHKFHGGDVFHGEETYGESLVGGKGERQQTEWQKNRECHCVNPPLRRGLNKPVRHEITASTLIVCLVSVDGAIWRLSQSNTVLFIVSWVPLCQTYLLLLFWSDTENFLPK